MEKPQGIGAFRLEKLKELRDSAINPYPAKSSRTHTIQEVLEKFELLQERSERVTIAGRIRSIREHGGSTFLHIADESGLFQVYLKKDVLGEELYNKFLELFDIGDIVEFSGTLFLTRKGEKTLLCLNFVMLAKALAPLPDKWHGLQDVEERFRKRYLDLLMNEEIRKRFVLRSKIIKELREFLWGENFIEVETPILQPIPGGARAKPFKTRLNALKMELYLRIAPELYLKRLLVGGFEKIFEIGKSFRNEGMDATHNPDFTMMELYAAYRDYEWMMGFTEKMLVGILRNIFGKSNIEYENALIDFNTPFRRVEFSELVQNNTGIDIWATSDAEISQFLKKHGNIMAKEATRANMLDELYKEFCKKNLVHPTFVTNLPLELNPLAKAKSDLAKASGDKKTAERFQLIAGGVELVNAFSELNDPIEQEKRLKHEIREYRKDAKRVDYEFLEALEHGMPPAAGMGLGIDRLVMLLTNSHAIREVILFPTMRPKSK